MEKTQKIKNFIKDEINSIDQCLIYQKDFEDKLNLTTKRLTYSNLLRSYFEDNTEIFKSYFIQANTYMDLQCYDQAIHQARLGKKLIQNDEHTITNLEKTEILIIECLLKKQKYLEAKEHFEKLQIKHMLQEYYHIQNKVMLQLKDKEKCLKALEKLENQIQFKYGDNSVEYGLYLIQKGRTYSAFDQIAIAIVQMTEGMNLLISKKYSNPQAIYEIYKQIASLYKTLGNSQLQYTNLICAESMVKQIDNHQTQLIQIMHKIAKNLLQRDQLESALLYLKKIQILQTKVYGDSSTQLGKTLKILSETLVKLGRKNEAKNYEQEYSRLLANSKQKPKEKTGKENIKKPNK